MEILRRLYYPPLAISYPESILLIQNISPVHNSEVVVDSPELNLIENIRDYVKNERVYSRVKIADALDMI